MQPIYFQRLKKKPTFNEIVGYLEADQQIMQYPDRTYTRLKDDQYYSILTMTNANILSSQSDNLIKDQARELERKKKMQELGLSQPQADAADIASGMDTPMDQQSQPSQRPQRPRGLDAYAYDDETGRLLRRSLRLGEQVYIGTPAPTSGRGSVATGEYETPYDQQQGDPFVPQDWREELQDRLEELRKEKEADAEANRQQVQGQVADEASARDSAKNMLSGIYGRVQQPSSTASQLEEVKRGRSAEYRSGSPVARNRGNSPYKATPQASSTGSRVKTLYDLKQGDAGQSASGSQDAPRGRSRERAGGASGSADTMTGVLEPVHETPHLNH
jgi:hypothetical protein